MRITEQQYAIFTHGEHTSAIRGSFMAIFNDWLPKSAYRAADAPAFERFDGRAGMGGFEIRIPIRP